MPRLNHSRDVIKEYWLKYRLLYENTGRLFCCWSHYSDYIWWGTLIIYVEVFLYLAKQHWECRFIIYIYKFLFYFTFLYWFSFSLQFLLMLITRCVFSGWVWATMRSVWWRTALWPTCLTWGNFTWTITCWLQSRPACQNTNTFRWEISHKLTRHFHTSLSHTSSRSRSIDSRWSTFTPTRLLLWEQRTSAHPAIIQRRPCTQASACSVIQCPIGRSSPSPSAASSTARPFNWATTERNRASNQMA